MNRPTWEQSENKALDNMTADAMQGHIACLENMVADLERKIRPLVSAQGRAAARLSLAREHLRIREITGVKN